MNTSKITLLLLGMSLLLGSGCAEVPPTHYYTFQPDIAASAATMPSATYPIEIAVETFEAASLYHQDKIVFRSSPYEVNFYEYHRWLRPPTELITEQVRKLLVNSGLFRMVSFSAYAPSPDYIVQGNILLFDQWYTDTSVTIQVALEYQLIASDQTQPLWRDVIESTTTVRQREMVETIKGFETALQKNILQAVAAMDRVLAQKR